MLYFPLITYSVPILSTCEQSIEHRKSAPRSAEVLDPLFPSPTHGRSHLAPLHLVHPSSQCMPPQPILLAPEILHTIFSHLPSSPPSRSTPLTRCSLVHSTWRPEAQRIYFALLVIKSPSRLTLLLARLLRVERLGRYVMGLKVEMMLDTPLERDSVKRTLVKFLGVVGGSLRSLSIKGNFFTLAEGEFRGSEVGGERFPILERLEWDDRSRDAQGGETLWVLWTESPRLRALTVRCRTGIGICPNLFSNSELLGHRRGLRSLTLETQFALEGIMNASVPAWVFGELKELDIEGSLIDASSSFFNVMGHTLHRLTYQHTPSLRAAERGPTVMVPTFDSTPLLPLKNLRSLSLFSPHPPTPAFFLSLPPTLEALTLKSDASVEQSLAQGLSSTNIKRLTIFEVRDKTTLRDLLHQMEWIKIISAVDLEGNLNAIPIPAFSLTTSVSWTEDGEGVKEGSGGTLLALPHIAESKNLVKSCSERGIKLQCWTV